jgi:hypothetical protein
MANVLEEYLVSVKYVVDGASQNKALEGLKRFAQSTLGVNLEIVGLTTALTKLTEKLAETGERWYWLSQQMGMSAGNLLVATDAMVALGMSSQQALSSLQGFTSWTQWMGPAATALLRSLGVTATDTAGRFAQLGPVLARMGGADPNNPNYWMALRWERLMGISPELGLRLARGEFAQQAAVADRIGAQVFGTSAWKQRVDEIDAQGRRLMGIVHQFSQSFRDLSIYFGGQLFPQVIPSFEHLFQLLQKHMPELREFLRIIADLAGMFFRLADLLATVVDRLVVQFERLPTSIKYVLAAIELLGLSFLRTPFGRVIAALSMLLLLLDDYLVWQQKGKTMFDWSAFDKAFHAKPDTGVLGFLEKMLGYVEQIGIWALIINALSFGGLGKLLRFGGRTGLGVLGRLLGIGAGAAGGAAVVGGAAAAGGASMLTGVGEILIGAAIAAMIYKAGEWVFNDPDVRKTLEEGADGFWDFLKSLFQNQQEMDPTTGSVHGPQGLLGRLFQGAGGIGPAGDPVKEADLMQTLQTKYGLSKEDAAAWVSNWEAESGLRPDITYGGGGYNEASNRAYGLMQWVGPRLAALRAYAASHHEDIRLLSTQLEFWWQESHSPQYRAIWEHLARAHGQEKAWTVFHEAESGGAPSLEKYGPGHVAPFQHLLGMPSVPPVGGVGGKASVQNNAITTSISIPPGPTAVSTAERVADKQTQVNREAVRNLRQAAVR